MDETSVKIKNKRPKVAGSWKKKIPTKTESRFVWHYFSISYIFITMLVP